MLADAFPQLPLAPIVGDVKHTALVEEVLAREKPCVIFHAGAYKHVPLMEETNAWQAVRNNAYGTWVLGKAAVAAKVEKFVLVSSDKAVNPTIVMGATKRLAEIVCQSLQGGRTQFVLVRFGNVFGSAGSVIPRFREQIARGGPVTVTHPDITRYFMSLSEATQLLLQAGLQGKGGEILVLDMGDPVHIVDLAHDMIRLYGADPDRIAIVFTGLRPGEKLYEELLTDEEATLPTPHPKLRIAQAREADRDAVRQMVTWCEHDRVATNEEYRRHIPDFTVICAPSFNAIQNIDGTPSQTFIVINFAKRICIIGNTAYGGEIKKSIFTVLNYLLPLEGVMPMHCSANIGKDGDVALFFGLSGTGKKTLSAEPKRRLIGDDEHGWSDEGIFNFEDGCYAKVIQLSPTAEPEIYACTQRFGSILENVIFDPVTRRIDLDDDSITENTRASYPLEFISNHVPEKLGGHPKNIILLTCDASGVMPPISRLTTEQAIYHFISGYTSKIAGTEIGLGKEPEITFSACFGARSF